MGRVLVDKMLQSIEKTRWPENREATELGRQVYQVGLDKVDENSSDLKTLEAALRIFRSGESAPYAYAGIAYALAAAAREKDGSYDQAGLDTALYWLEKAQTLVPDLVPVNMVEAYVYLYGDRFHDARVVLDFLQSLEPANFFLAKAEAFFWARQNELREAVDAFHEAMEVADSVPRKMRLKKQLGDFYLEQNAYDEALEIFLEAVHFEKHNPEVLHKVSYIYWQKGDFEEANRYNRRVLSIEKLPAALKMQEALKDKLQSGGLASRLFGR